MQCCRDVGRYTWEKMDLGAAGAAFDTQTGEGGAAGKNGGGGAAGGAIGEQAGAAGGAGAAGKHREAAAFTVGPWGVASAEVGAESEEEEDEDGRIGASRPSPVALMALSPLARCALHTF